MSRDTGIYQIFDEFSLVDCGHVITHWVRTSCAIGGALRHFSSNWRHSKSSVISITICIMVWTTFFNTML